MRLIGMRAYLCGAMDRVPDGGIVWRDKITPVLEEMGVVVLNPARKPIDIGIEDEEHRASRRKAKEQGDYTVFQDRMIRHVDLRMVDESSFLICSIDVSVHACGTYEEIFWANRQKRPVLVWCQQGKINCPDWLLWTLPHEHIFDSLDDLITYLGNVSSGADQRDFGRWLFFDLKEPTIRALLRCPESRDLMRKLLTEYE